MKQRGFTLMELMVVLGIFGVVAVMAYGGLAGVMNARAHVTESLERTEALQKAYLSLRNDFQQLRARSIRDNFGMAQGPLVLDPQGAVEFTRNGWRNPLGAPRPSLQRVRWRLEDHRLIRGYFRVLDRAQNSEPVEVAVLDKVDSVEWRFMDKTLQWHSQWPVVGGAPNIGDTPRAVELTLHLADIGPVTLLFSAVIPP